VEERERDRESERERSEKDSVPQVRYSADSEKCKTMK
jgi:hypothetical protein